MRVSTLLPFAIVAALLVVPGVEAHKKAGSGSTQHHSVSKSEHSSKAHHSKTPHPTSTKASSTKTKSGHSETTSAPKPTSSSKGSSSSGSSSITTGKPLPTPGPSLGEDTLDPSGLFPIAFKTAFSTSPSMSSKANVKITTLNDTDIGVTKPESGVTHAIVAAPNAPDGTMAWLAKYPKGSYNPSGEPRGGLGMYVGGPSGFDFTSANELLFSYAVMFEEGFDFVKGGKLPGPYGGTSADEAYACSGGRQEDRNLCFDLRLMFRTNGMGEVYAYMPEVDSNASALLDNPTGSIKDSAYGFSISRGAFSFVPGKWAVVAERVKLNDPSATNGEIELFVNGKSVINVSGLVLRQSAESVFRGAHFQTFFGGATSDWATPKDQQAWFADVSAAIIS